MTSTGSELRGRRARFMAPDVRRIGRGVALPARVWRDVDATAALHAVSTSEVVWRALVRAGFGGEGAPEPGDEGGAG